MSKKLFVAFVLVLLPTLFAVRAQGQVLIGNCRASSGTANPEGVVAGRVCDIYLNTSTGVLYEKWTGTGNTGWGVGHNTNERVNGNADITGYVGVPGFVSQLTGWRMTAAGALDARYISTDEFHAKQFIADLEVALAGSQTVCKSVTSLGSNFTNPAPGGIATLTVRDLPSAENTATFQTNDWVGLKTFTRTAGSLTIGYTFGVVTAYADQIGGVQTWTYTRGAGADAGGMATGTVVASDAIVLDYGTSGNGCTEQNAIDGLNGVNSPYFQTWVWTGSPIPANRGVRTRLGNLRGITGVAEHGAILGAYGTGTASYVLASGVSGVVIHNANLSIYDSGGIEVIKLDRTAPSLALGAAVPTAYGTGTGIWMGRDVADNVWKSRVGTPGGAGWFWDGASMTVRGTGGWGRNMTRNSDCAVSVEDWGVGQTGGGYTIASTFNVSGKRLFGESNTCALVVTGTPANGNATFLANTYKNPVIAGNRYEASFYVGLVGVNNGAFAQILWYDAADAFISSNNSTIVCTNASAGGAALVNFCRTGLVATAPTGAVAARYQVASTFDGTTTNPATYAVHAFFAEATSTQTELTQWGPGGETEIIGGMIKNDAIITRHILAGAITAAKITVSNLSAINANLGDVTAGSAVLGSSNKIWVNESADGILAVGGATKASAPFRVAATGDVTINAGTITCVICTAGSGNEVTLNSNGITITGGTGVVNQVKWDSGGQIFSRANGSIYIGNNGATSFLDISPSGGLVTLLSNGTLFLGGVNASSIFIETTAGFSGSGNRVVCVDNSGALFKGASNTAC